MYTYASAEIARPDVIQLDNGHWKTNSHRWTLRDWLMTDRLCPLAI